MNLSYEDLLKSQLCYGTTKEDILKREDFDKVYENVVIAPWWGIEMFNNYGFEIIQINRTLYNLKKNNIEFSFISLKQVGAPAIMDDVLSLGVSKCKYLLFIGSAGSLVEEINIGDLIIPTHSICGDGASKYLNKNLEDDFGKSQKPDNYLTEMLIKSTQIISNEEEIKYYNVTNFSVDTIFGQFPHINIIKDMGAQVIEMETHNVFKCAKIANIKATALLCVSDNTITNKSLYSGRTKEENEYRHKVRYEIIPKIILHLFEELHKNR